MKYVLGKIFYALGKFSDVFFKLLIKVSNKITIFGINAKQLVSLYAITCCIGIIAFPPFIVLILRSDFAWVFWLLLIIMILPTLGRGAMLLFKKQHYVFSNFFYDRSDYYRNGKSKRNLNFYKDKYQEELNRKLEEERKRQEEARRKYQEQQDEHWRRIFEEHFRGSYQTGNSNWGSSNANPFNNFKSSYESSCDVLGVAYNSTYQEIKSAYRKLAKKYHPDLSKEKNAEEMFKKVNNAFDFLSEENVERYRRLG